MTRPPEKNIGRFRASIRTGRWFLHAKVDYKLRTGSIATILELWMSRP